MPHKFDHSLAKRVLATALKVRAKLSKSLPLFCTLGVVSLVSLELQKLSVLSKHDIVNLRKHLGPSGAAFPLICLN